MPKEYKVHVATADGIIVQLGDGFGRLSKETLGNDVMAERLLKHLATREVVRAAPRRTRDSQGYLNMGIALEEIWSGVLAYPPQISSALRSLYRSHQIISMGSVIAGRAVKSTSKGTIYSLTSGITAVAPLEPSPNGGSANVRVLSYDAATGGVTVTGNQDVVSRGPSGAEEEKALLRHFKVGTAVQGKVVLAKDSQGLAVVEVVLPPLDGVSHALSALGYVLSSGKQRFTLHSEVEVTVAFVPPTADIADCAPFVIFSDRQSFAAIPHVRTAVPATRMSGPLPWRDRTDGDDEADRAAHEEGDRPLRKRRIEEAIDAFERDETSVPKSPEEFQKLLLGSPNSSYLWTQYMAFHVGLQQYEEARLVAEKALRTIGVRESKELLNVWVAYMNLENAQGTAESLTSVFRRALQHNDDSLIVHEKLADIFKGAKKYQQLHQLCRVMTSKFREHPKVWERMGLLLIEMDKRDQLKRLIKEMGEALKKHDACIVVEHLAIHEYRNGSVPNGRALFEGLVSRLPKQSDLWSVFLDQELGLLARKDKEANSTLTRDIFERVTAVPFSAKVMQQLLTRFLSFEQAFGSPQGVEKVKAKARSYVESKIASTGAAE